MSVATISLHLAVLTRFRGSFGPKKAVLGRKMRSFAKAPPDLAPRPPGATGESWLKTWIWQGHHLDFRMARGGVEPGAMRPTNGQNGKEKRLVACLLACLLLEKSKKKGNG